MFYHGLSHFKNNFSTVSALKDISLKKHPDYQLTISSLLPEQITEAVFPRVQLGMPRAVTGQVHKKDSAPEQWNRASQILSPPSTKYAPFGVETATPQPSCWQTTLALAIFQCEAQSVFHCPEICISTCPSHWEIPFFMSRTSVYTNGRRQYFRQISCLSYPRRVCGKVEVPLCISPEQKTWTAPRWHASPGQDSLWQNQSSGSCPLHWNSLGQTLYDSLIDISPRKDTALPHPSSAQMTWAVSSVKFPSDSGTQSLPECTSTRPKQGPSPPARRTNPKRKKKTKPNQVNVHDSGLAVRSGMSCVIVYDH